MGWLSHSLCDDDSLPPTSNNKYHKLTYTTDINQSSA